MPTADELRIIFRTEAQKAVKDMQEVRKQTDEAAGGFAGLSKNALTLATAGAGLSIALNGVYSALSENIEAYKVQESADKRLEGVLRATGEAAGFNAAELKAMASDLQALTAIEDEATEAAMAVLLTFKSIKDVNFERAINSAQDLSAVLGSDMKSASVMLGKALENPAKGVSALAEVGVTFTDAQAQMIKSLQETNNLAEAQGVILDVLDGQVGGVARTMRQTATGDLESLNISFNSLREASGEAALHGLRPVVQWLDDVVGSASDAWKEINKLKQAVAGEIAIEEDMIALQRERVAAAKEALADAMNYQDEQSAEQRLKKETDALNVMLERLRVEEELGMIELKRGRQQAERAAAEQKALEERYQALLREEALHQKALENQEFLDNLYSSTDQGRIADLQAQLDKLDKISWSAHNLEKVESVRAALQEKMNKLLDEGGETEEDKGKDVSLLNRLMEEQQDRIRELADAQEALRQVEFLIYAAQMDGDEKRIANLIKIREEIQAIIQSMEGGGDASWDFTGLLDQIRSEIGGSLSYITTTVINAFGGDAALWGQLADGIMEGLGGALQILEDELSGELGESLNDALTDALDMVEGLGGYFKVASAVMKIVDTIFEIITGSGDKIRPDFGILDAEKNLADARIELIQETIREEERLRGERLSRLEAEYNREYQILKDMLDRNLIDHGEFADRAAELYDNYATQEEAVNDEADAAIDAEEAAKELAEAIADARGEIEATLEELGDVGFFESIFGWITGDSQDRMSQIAALSELLEDLDSVTTMEQLLELLRPFDIDTGDGAILPDFLLSSAPPSSSSSVTVNVTGPVYGVDDLYMQLQEAGERLDQRSRS